MIHVDTRL